jgi:hypothetical protein
LEIELEGLTDEEIDRDAELDKLLDGEELKEDEGELERLEDGLKEELAEEEMEEEKEPPAV